MSKFWTKVGETVISMLTSREFYRTVKDAVSRLFDSSMTGEEKRKKTLSDLEDVARPYGKNLLGLAVEMAVASLKNK